MKTKYFSFETMATKQVEEDFLNKLNKVSDKVLIFRTGFGEFILCVTAFFDENCETEQNTPLDIFHDFRKTINLKKEYSRKPNLEKKWIGKWETTLS